MPKYVTLRNIFVLVSNFTFRRATLATERRSNANTVSLLVSYASRPVKDASSHASRKPLLSDRGGKFELLPHTLRCMLTLDSGKYLAALEERMKSMETLLKQSNEKSPDNVETPPSFYSTVTPPAILQEQAKTMKCKLPGWATDGSHLTKPQFPSKDQAIRLAQGYFACSDHSFPIFAKDAFFLRMNTQYPPEQHTDPVWRSTVLAVLCYAHRLRAMSTPLEADAENDEACWYMMPALDLVPQLTYGKPSVARAQVLLCIASILRGTAMPEAAPMLVSAAIRMLQCLGIHREDPLEKFSPAERRERECLFWCAYILDKDIALQTGRPPVLYEQDISRRPPSEYHDDEIGVVRSLDSSTKVDLFVASQRLAAIQGQVWSKIYSGAEPADRAMLHAAQDELNPVLAAWKAGFPFQFSKEALVSRWPKHAILQTVVLYFKYCHTLVELNKVPHMEKIDGSPLLESSCPTSKALSTYPHSSARVATDAARDALDLASLTPRGNFQNAW